MKISDLHEMESIVKESPFLHWEGWNVVCLEQDPNAHMKKNAMFHNQQWHKKTVFENENGFWDIPDNVLRKGNV